MTTVEMWTEYTQLSDEMLHERLKELDNEIFRCTSRLWGKGPTDADPKPLHERKAAIYDVLHERSLNRAR